MNNYRKFYNRGHFYNQNADQEIFTKGGGLYLMCESREKGLRGSKPSPSTGNSSLLISTKLSYKN